MDGAAPMTRRNRVTLLLYPFGAGAAAVNLFFALADPVVGGTAGPAACMVGAGRARPRPACYAPLLGPHRAAHGTGGVAGLTDWLEFAAALAAFFASHLLPARPGVRERLIALLGRRLYFALYGTISLLVLGWLIPRRRPGAVRGALAADACHALGAELVGARGLDPRRAGGSGCPGPGPSAGGAARLSIPTGRALRPSRATRCSLR